VLQEGEPEVCSFDRDIDRIPGIHRREPSALPASGAG
jgi:hypothetical protein